MEITFGEGAAHEEIIGEELPLVAVTRQHQFRAAVRSLGDAHGVVIQHDGGLCGICQGQQFLQRHPPLAVRNDAGAAHQVKPVQHDAAVVQRRDAGLFVKLRQRGIVRLGIVVAQDGPLAVFRRQSV